MFQSLNDKVFSSIVDVMEEVCSSSAVMRIAYLLYTCAICMHYRVNPNSKPSGVKWLHFKAFGAILITYPFNFFDIRALWRSVLSARVLECQKVKKGGLDQYGTERFGGLILSQSEKVWNWKGEETRLPFNRRLTAANVCKHI